MNKRLHRVVFNASRGTRMVVQETARSAGKAGSGATSAAVSVAALAAALLTAPLHAQIVADPNAPGRQRPTVLAAPNGVPLVNIQTPSAAGVSRNTYSQFDVQRNGAVLNNSRTNAQTQLGGWVQGNPWLAGGSARVILNEVNSGNPSQLRGYVEVAGPRSEVIIANPAGIQVDGAGFINASRATLTTGVPQFGTQGGLDNFVVRSGTIGIDGAGLDVRSTDYAAILARAVQVNAGIWASELKVVSGAHQVGADASQTPSTTPVGGTGTAPAFAVDVAQLGGMYANKITLVGTEAGVGMRSAGLLGAGAGGLIVTAAGRLENIGTLEAPRLDVAVTGDLVNRGTIRQSGSAALTIAAPVLANTNGGTIGAEPVPADTAGGAAGAEGGDPATGATPAGAPASTPTTSSSPASPAPAASPLAPAAPLAPGSLGATSAVRNDGGHIYAGGPVRLQTPRVDNTGGQLEVASLAVDGPTFTNAGGVLKVQQGFSANVEHFDNAGGRLQASTLDIRSSDALNNRGGALTADGDITLSVAGALDNVDGRISGGRHVSVDAGSVASSGTSLLGAGVRADGSLAPAGDLRVNSAGVVQAAGTLVAAGDMALQGARLDLSGSRASAAAIAFTATQGDVVTRGAMVSTPGTLTIQADAAHTQTLVNEAGVLSAGRMALSAAHIANTQGGQIVQTGTDAQRIAVQGRLDNSGGVIASNAQDLSLAADVIADVDGQITHAGNGTLRMDAARAFDGTRGRIVSNGTLDLHADRFVHDGGTLDAQRVAVTAGSLSNRAGEITQSGSGTTQIAVQGLLDNSGGRIASNGQDAGLTAATLRNEGGTIDHAGAGTLSVTTNDYQGAQGRLASQGTLVVQAGRYEQAGGSTSANRVSMDAAELGNRGGQIVQTGTDTTRIAVAGTLDNDGGLIASNGRDMAIAAATLSNAAGQIQHVGEGALNLALGSHAGAGGQVAGNGALVVQASGAFAQDGGRLSARQIAIDAASLSNRDGQIVQTGVDATRIGVAGAFDNTGGTLASNGALALHAERIDQDGGSTTAQQITIDTVDLRNVGGRIVQSGTGATRIAASGTLVNDGGTLASNGGGVSISAGTLSNAKGRIEHAGVGELALKVGDYQGNGGEIASSGALVVQAAGAFQQDGGKTAAERIRIEADSLSNRGGTMAQSGADSTHIAIAGTLDNTTGLIASNGTDVDLVAGTLINNDGSLQHAGGGTLSIDAARFEGARGQVATDGALVVHAGDWSQDGGTTRAQHLTIDADTLRNVGGQILQVGDQATRIEVAGTLANDSGIIASNGADMALRAGSISNAQGQLQHAGAGTLSIDTASLDGPQGRIVGNGALVVHAGSFGNDAGVASANQVSIDAVDLSNRGGTISQGGTGTTRIAASGRLVNDGGTLSTRGEDFALSAGALSNAAGAIQHAGTGELNLHTTDYQGTGGSIASNGAVVVQATGAFQQDGGTLQAERIAIDAGALSSRGGQIVQVGHQASHIAIAGVFDNSQGVVISNAQDIGLAAATFVNEAGTVQHAGTGTLAIDAGTVRGAGGNLASNGTLELQATHLLNDGASIQAGMIAIDAGALSNRGGQIVQNGAGTARIEVAGLLDNRSGLIGTRTDSGAAVDLAVQSIENADGRVVADGDLKVRSTGDLRNDGGVLRAGSSLDLKVEGTLGNAQGRIEAAGEGASLALQANVIDNTEGRIANAGSGTTALTATSVTNASNSTDGTTGVIAGNGSVALTATTLQNLANGHLSSGGAMLLNVADRLTNRGVVESNGTLEFDQPDATLDNASGRISAAGDLRVAVRDVVNDGGSITTAGGSGGDLSLAATQLSNMGGTLSSDRDLRLSLPGSYSNAELLHAGRDLIVTLGGRLDNSGTLEANGTLRADVAGLGNAAGGRIQATHVDLHAAGALDNRGEITGDTVAAKADSVSNTEAGAITGGSVTLAARSIVNAGPQALIAATDNVALWATERVSNTHGATVYSGGDVQIAGSAERDADGRLSSNTGMVLNSASTIEAERDIEMAATSLRNERLGVSVLQRERKSLDEQHTLSMPTWWRNADGNNFAYNPNASNYSPYEVYYVKPSDIISRTPYVTPDGYQIERIEYRTHANDTAFFSGRAGRSGAYGHRERLSATDGTRVLYAIRNQKDVPNPDQVAGVTSGVWEGEEHVTHWDAAAPAFDPAYGNCAADCVRFVTQPGYTDPTTTLIRDTQEARGPSTRLSELRREAHTVAYDDVQAPGAGEPGRIVAGRDISVGFTDTLVNSYADVLAGRERCTHHRRPHPHRGREPSWARPSRVRAT